MTQATGTILDSRGRLWNDNGMGHALSPSTSPDSRDFATGVMRGAGRTEYKDGPSDLWKTPTYFSQSWQARNHSFLSLEPPASQARTSPMLCSRRAISCVDSIQIISSTWTTLRADPDIALHLFPSSVSQPSYATRPSRSPPSRTCAHAASRSARETWATASRASSRPSRTWTFSSAQSSRRLSTSSAISSARRRR